ncbi:MAG: IS3 family transposase [Alphaproteobacteria bacterium GM202ARS2]|nr:IS3 family transposase [Alphaproteobacteria bacterium GM202ARS2]
MPITTDSRHSHAIAPNLLEQKFDAAQPNTVCLADISYIPTDEGWLYLAAVKDLATMESFFSSLKTELVHRTRFATRREAKAALFEYIEIFYNRQRRHSSIGYRTPEQARMAITAAKAA